MLPWLCLSINFWLHLDTVAQWMWGWKKTCWSCWYKVGFSHSQTNNFEAWNKTTFPTMFPLCSQWSGACRFPCRLSSCRAPCQLWTANSSSTLWKWVFFCSANSQKHLRVNHTGRLSSLHPARYSYQVFKWVFLLCPVMRTRQIWASWLGSCVLLLSDWWVILAEQWRFAALL